MASRFVKSLQKKLSREWVNVHNHPIPPKVWAKLSSGKNFSLSRHQYFAFRKKTKRDYTLYKCRFYKFESFRRIVNTVNRRPHSWKNFSAGKRKTKRR